MSRTSTGNTALSRNWRCRQIAWVQKKGKKVLKQGKCPKKDTDKKKATFAFPSPTRRKRAFPRTRRNYLRASQKLSRTRREIRDICEEMGIMRRVQSPPRSVVRPASEQRRGQPGWSVERNLQCWSGSTTVGNSFEKRFHGVHGWLSADIARKSSGKSKKNKTGGLSICGSRRAMDFQRGVQH